MSNIWFTGYTHFDHYNIIKHCNRPFSSQQEMNEVLIENWNKVVQPKDKVYHLGDFSFSSIERVNEILKMLNGKVYLIRGNHDRKNIDKANFNWVKIYYELNINKQSYILFHYPIETWARKHYGSIHIHSHVHNRICGNTMENRFNVGVDVNNFYPISLEEILGSTNIKEPEKFRDLIDKMSSESQNRIQQKTSKLLLEIEKGSYV